MNKLYVMVGVPGSGKSTWIKNQVWSNDCVIVSTDEHVEAYAKKVKKTYTEVFDEYMPTAVELMAADVVKAREEGKDIIWDQTSTTIKSRARKINMLPNYYKIAVVIRPNKDAVFRNLIGRPDKPIPNHVVHGMIDNWEEPTEEEGFDEIWYAE
jgi:predicted kinase